MKEHRPTWDNFPYKCRKCGNEWYPGNTTFRTQTLPIQCPRCKQPKWWIARKRRK